MVFKATLFLPARRRLRLPSVSHPVIDTNTLREAALRASWQRDQRVARRRLALRWALWWLWKYRLRLLAVCAALAAVIYLLYRLGYLSPAGPPPATPAPLAPGPGVALRLDTQLQPLRTPAASLRPAPAGAPDPHPLKLETQLKIKEPTP